VNLGSVRSCLRGFCTEVRNEDHHVIAILRTSTVRTATSPHNITGDSRTSDSCNTQHQTRGPSHMQLNATHYTHLPHSASFRRTLRKHISVPPDLLRSNTRFNRPLNPIVKPQNTLLAFVVHRIQLRFDSRVWALSAFFRREFEVVPVL